MLHLIPALNNLMLWQLNTELLKIALRSLKQGSPSLNEQLQEISQSSNIIANQYLNSLEKLVAPYSLTGKVSGSFNNTNLYSYFDTHSKQDILLIPSPINGPDILDLAPSNSLARFLQQQGYRTHLIDWGSSYKSSPSLEDYTAIINHYLRSLNKPVVLGHCLGGLLALGCQDEFTLGKILLGTPFDMSVYPKSNFIHSCPWQSALQIRCFFAAKNYASDILRISKDTPFDKSLSNWLTRLTPISPRIFAQLNEPDFIHQFLANFQFKNPLVTAIIGLSDTVVPATSSKLLKNFLPSAELVEIPYGHIGLILKAQQDILKIIQKYTQ